MCAPRRGPAVRPRSGGTANHKPSSQHGSCKVPLEHRLQVGVTGGHSWDERSCRGQPVAGGGCPRRGAQQRSSATPEPSSTPQLHSLQRRIGSAHIKNRRRRETTGRLHFALVSYPEARMWAGGGGQDGRNRRPGVHSGSYLRKRFSVKMLEIAVIINPHVDLSMAEKPVTVA